MFDISRPNKLISDNFGEKSAKKVTTEVVFEEVLEELKNSFQEEPFKDLDGEALKKKKTSELWPDVKKLPVKYNNIKQQ